MSSFSFYLIILNDMVNYKSQNLTQIILWQHFMDSVVCFQLDLGSKTQCHGLMAFPKHRIT